MAFIAGKDTAFKLDNAAGSLQTLTAYVNSIDFPGHEVNLLDTSMFGDSAHSYVPGLKDGSFTISGGFDSTMNTHLAALLGISGTSSVEIHPAGTGSGTPKFTFEARMGSYKINSAVADLVTYSAEFKISGVVTLGTN